MDILQYTFFQNALIGAFLASILCGFIGTYIVTRRLVFISGGTIPQMTANLFTYNYRQMIWASIILGWIDCIVGLYASYMLNVPSGATIIFVSIIIFAIAKLWKGIRKK